MCKELPIIKKLYSTTDLNLSNQLLKPCSGCPPRKAKRCKAKMLKIKGTDSNPIPQKSQHRASFIKRGPPPSIKGTMINRRIGFISEPTGKIINGRLQYKIIKIPYLRLTNRYDKLIR